MVPGHYEMPESLKNVMFLNLLKHILHLFPTLGVELACVTKSVFLLDMFTCSMELPVSLHGEKVLNATKKKQNPSFLYYNIFKLWKVYLDTSIIVQPCYFCIYQLRTLSSVTLSNNLGP